MSKQDFAGKTVLITAASRGIGLAIAHRLVEEGARVCITARHADQLAAAVGQFPSGSVIGEAGSADDPEHRERTCDRVATELGGIDILVNGAGINPVYGPLEELDLDAARKVLEVNVIGTLAWTQSALRHGLGSKPSGGAIVNLSSYTGDIPSEGIGWYGISKAAVSHLTRTLSVELAPRVRVNAVAPAVIKTRFASALYEGREDEVAAAYPLGRLGTPEDVAETVAFLAGERSRWITGQVITIDGGLRNAGGTA